MNISSIGLESSNSVHRKSLSNEDFMKILTEQLRNQNPLDPMDNSEFMNQMVGINSLEQINVLADTLKGLESRMKLLFGVGFIGKEVTGLSGTGAEISGKVESVLQSKDGIMLNVGNYQLPVDSVSLVKEVENGIN